MPLPELGINVVVLLTLSSTLPVIVRLLGVTTVNVTGIYTFYAFLKNWPLCTIAYKLLIIVLSFKELRNTVHALRHGL